MKAPLLAFIIAISVCAASGEELVITIKHEAQKCAKAVLTNDYGTIIRYTHPRVVKAIGGRDAMLAGLKKGMSQMRADGADFIDVVIGQPETPKKIGTWTTSVVSQHLVMKVPGGKLYRDASLLGISEDDGKTWVFVDLGPVTKEQFGQVFPELDGKINMPDKKAAEFKEDAPNEKRQRVP